MASKNLEDCVEKIQEHFNCGICLESVKAPMMCSKCSKIFCNFCIERWLELKNRCPHCRHNLTPGRLVKCGWVEQITEELEAAKHKDMCEIHRLPLSIYCKMCLTCVCAHCALFDNPHQSHEICPLDEVFSAIKDDVQQETKKLTDRFIYLSEQIKLLDRNIANCEAAMAKNFKDAHSDLKRNLENILNSKRNYALEQKQKIEQEMDFIANVSVSVDEQVGSVSASDYLEFAETIKSQLIEAQNVPLSEFEPELQDADIFSCFNVSPPFTSITFTLYQFSQLKVACELVKSQVLSINGRIVRLNILPDGKGTLPQRPIVFSIELIDVNDFSKSTHEFKLEVINQYGNKSKDKICQFYVELGEGCPATYEIPIHVTAKNVEQEGFVDPSKDCFVVKFSGRSVSYQSKCEDQEQYIKKLEKIALEQESAIRNLRCGKLVPLEDIPTRRGSEWSVSSQQGSSRSSSRTSLLGSIFGDIWWKL